MADEMRNIIVGVETPIYFDMLFEKNCQIKLEFYRRFGKTDLPTNIQTTPKLCQHSLFQIYPSGYIEKKWQVK